MNSFALPATVAFPTVKGIAYAYESRRNGWYCFRFDGEGNQMGEAIYLYSKREILDAAMDLAMEHGVKVVR